MRNNILGNNLPNADPQRRDVVASAPEKSSRSHTHAENAHTQLTSPVSLFSRDVRINALSCTRDEVVRLFQSPLAIVAFCCAGCSLVCVARATSCVTSLSRPTETATTNFIFRESAAASHLFLPHRVWFTCPVRNNVEKRQEKIGNAAIAWESHSRR